MAQNHHQKQAVFSKYLACSLHIETTEIGVSVDMRSELLHKMFLLRVVLLTASPMLTSRVKNWHYAYYALHSQWLSAATRQDARLTQLVWMLQSVNMGAKIKIIQFCTHTLTQCSW